MDSFVAVEMGVHPTSAVCVEVPAHVHCPWAFRALALWRSVCDSCETHPFSRPSVEDHVRQTHPSVRIRKRGLFPAAQGLVKLSVGTYLPHVAFH